MLSLVTKGVQSDMIFKVVEEHKDLNTRLAASRLIALGANAPEKLRMAILEAVYRGEPNGVARQMVKAN